MPRNYVVPTPPTYAAPTPNLAPNTPMMMGEPIAPPAPLPPGTELVPEGTVLFASEQDPKTPATGPAPMTPPMGKATDVPPPVGTLPKAMPGAPMTTPARRCPPSLEVPR